MDDNTVEKKNQITEKTTSEIVTRLMNHAGSNTEVKLPPSLEENNNVTGLVVDQNLNEPSVARTVKAPIITPPLLSEKDDVVMVNHIVHQKRDKIPARIDVTEVLFRRVHFRFMERKKRNEKVTDNMLSLWTHEEKNCLWMENSLVYIPHEINDKWIQSFKNFYGIRGPPNDLNFVAFNADYQRMYYHDYYHYAGKQQDPQRFPQQQNLQQFPQQQNLQQYPQQQNLQRFPQTLQQQFPQQNLQQFPQQNLQRFPQQNLQQFPQQNLQQLPQQNLQQHPRKNLQLLYQFPQDNLQPVPQKNLQQFPAQPQQHLRHLLQQPLTPLPPQMAVNNNSININNTKPPNQPVNKACPKKEQQIQKNPDPSTVINYDNYNRVTPIKAPYNTPIQKRNQQKPSADELNFNNGVIDNDGEPLLDLSCERKRKRADSDSSSAVVDKKKDNDTSTATDADPKI